LGVPAVVAERVIGHELPDLLAVYDVHAYEAETRGVKEVGGWRLVLGLIVRHATQ